MPYRVFLNAPTFAALKKQTSGDKYSWQTARSNSPGVLSAGSNNEETQPVRVGTSRSKDEESLSNLSIRDPDAQEWLIPPATLGAASQRISEMYKNVIFSDVEEEEDDWKLMEQAAEDESGAEDESHTVHREETLISWPPTAQAQSQSRALTGSLFFKTQDDSDDLSYAHTSTSSITAFPTFIINLHALTSLSDLANVIAGKWTRKVNLLVAVLEVDGPDVVRIKRGPDAGREIGVLKLVIGGEEGGICKLTAWRGVADAWGGVRDWGSDDESFEDNESVRRGDIVYIENILASSSAPCSDTGKSSARPSMSLTASPNLASRLHICYRTLPTVPSDRRFRPDLRLAASDPGLRKVASVVRWFQGVMGIDCA
ncbi:uncharacterized protein FOMMEDRAFT_149739 [Fomitiporia mediterranea MF3/22]|uniref:uncharacterized protein n=1 Tax=Fomitiporia mediterranea (strain MF3/22) TaxID=694068 RepID=UPI00044088B9|nr:uncharacterized protein FOMMEDRAFT_149739 [Fomitiporia mediterranea MF3/22]EJD07228.1 hypothetical protein FOMMEDRAFT_149739 [Fomitiporia mediterranea MF3/22]